MAGHQGLGVVNHSPALTLSLPVDGVWSWTWTKLVLFSLSYLIKFLSPGNSHWREGGRLKQLPKLLSLQDNSLFETTLPPIFLGIALPSPPKILVVYLCNFWYTLYHSSSASTFPYHLPHCGLLKLQSHLKST